MSCGIVLRSFILRRRFRRRIEAAIAAGVLLPEQVEALRRRGPAVGERPTMWEVRIGKGGANAAVGGVAKKSSYDYPMSGADRNDAADDDWANVMVRYQSRRPRSAAAYFTGAYDDRVFFLLTPRLCSLSLLRSYPLHQRKIHQIHHLHPYPYPHHRRICNQRLPLDDPSGRGCADGPMIRALFCP